jgi:RimJ/RimL family protein N-acetyltransferase
MDNKPVEASLLRGEKVRLAAANAETDSEAMAAWSRDPELLRMFDTQPARHWTPRGMTELTLKLQGENEQATMFPFAIRRLADDQLIGLSSLDVDTWPNRDAWVGISIGERANWSQGYGSDAMRLLLRYAFVELNLARVSLNVFGYNERAQRSYLKVGFKVEGCERERLRREDKRYDLIYMSVLRDEWLARAEA